MSVQTSLVCSTQTCICSSKIFKSCAKAWLFFLPVWAVLRWLTRTASVFVLCFASGSRVTGFCGVRSKLHGEFAKSIVRHLSGFCCMFHELEFVACEAKESCLPGTGTRRREPRFPPSCESSFFLYSTAKIGERRPLRNGVQQSGYRCVPFANYSQFTDSVLLHRSAALRRVRHDSAAQLVGLVATDGTYELHLTQNFTVGCDDLGAPYQTIRSRTTVGAHIVRPDYHQMDTSIFSQIIVTVLDI